MLIFITAIVGVYYARYEGLNTLKAGFLQLRRNEAPTYERGPFSNPLHIVLAALFIIVLPIVAFSAYCIKTKD